MGEREGGKQVLKRVKQSQKQASRLTTIWVDGGFDGEPQIAMGHGFLPLPKRRWCCDRNAPSGFMLLKKRWLVERTFGWLMGCRRLVRDYELLPETSETFIYLAMIRIMVRRLA